MKYIITFSALLCCLCVGFSSFAQNNDQLDERLLAKFSENELGKLTTEEVAYWTYFLDHAYEIQDIPKGKVDGVTNTVQLSSTRIEDVNLFELGLTPHEFARTYYRIGETNKMILLYGQSEIDKNFKASSK